ncbi:MAG: hypothetical protein RRC34_04285 [Lentisphaeria bacterium]|nr:hypothetical protein [Lentisphaeria bacterium]
MKIETIIPVMLASWIVVGSGVFLYNQKEQDDSSSSEPATENTLHTLSYMISESRTQQGHVLSLYRLINDTEFSPENKRRVAQLMVGPTLACLRHAKTVNRPAYDNILKDYPIKGTIRKNLNYNADVTLRCLAECFDFVEKPREVSQDDWDMLKKTMAKVVNTPTLTERL